MSKNKLRAGVIGVGHLGKHHARIYNSLPDIELTAIADINQVNLDSNAALYSCQAFRDYTAMFDLVDLVSVAVPTTDHFKVASEFLEKGKHVLVEKPITATVEQGRKLVDLANALDRVLMVGQSERFNPAIYAVSNQIHDPKFIEIHRLGPFTSRATDVDVVLDLMIHDVDLILSWVKDRVSGIQAMGVPVLCNRIDIANARIEFDHGCTANLTASRVSMQSTRKARVFQGDSYVSIDCLNQRVDYYRRRAGTVPVVSPMDMIEVVPFEIEKIEPLSAELQSFVKAVSTGKDPSVTGEAGLNALEICCQINEIIKTKLDLQS